MNIVSKFFNELNTKELYELLRVRAEVFVVEQECVYQDLDGVDYRSLHVMGTGDEDEKILAYLRIFMKEEEKKIAQIGRVLTTKRSKGYGAEVVTEGIRLCKEKLIAEGIYLEAQSYAIGFYERAGFKVCSEEFLEDGIPHVQMFLKLD